MKKLIRNILFILFVLHFSNGFCQDTWIQKTTLPGAARSSGIGCSIGTKGYVGLGIGAIQFIDLWEWNQATDTWTQKANLPANCRNESACFVIGTKIYVATGIDCDSSMYYTNHYSKEFWEWDQLTDIWTRKADFGGAPRGGAVGFSIGTKGYVMTGGPDTLTDFWEWDQATDSWIQKQNLPFNSRVYATGYSIGNKGYVGFGDNLGSGIISNDLWEWDAATEVWTQKTSLPGTARELATGFTIGDTLYVGTGSNGSLAPGNTILQDFWQWNSSTDTWIQKTNFSGGVRFGSLGFSIGNKGYFATGTDNNLFFHDLWEYTPGITTNLPEMATYNLKLSIYPNPVVSVSKVKLNNSGNKLLNVKIYDSMGQVIKTISSLNEFVLEKSDFSSGLYFISVDQSSFQKFVVE